MDNWIETAAGSLIKASSMTIIGVREAREGEWEVTVSVATNPAPFASKLPSRGVARAVRNSLAVHVSTEHAQAPCTLFFDDETLQVAVEPLEAPVP